jgi:hypothetical protein
MRLLHTLRYPLLVISILLVAALIMGLRRAEQPGPAPVAPAEAAGATAATPEPSSTVAAPTIEPTMEEPSATRPPTRTARPAISPTPSGIPSPTPRPPGTPPRVGIQIGHWQAEDLPDELSRLRTSLGTFAGGYTEAEVNLDIGQRVAALLEAEGVIVDLLPATIPPGYDADVFVTLHCDGASSTGANGFKLATPWRASRASQLLLEAITGEYAAATGMPQDGNITVNMRGYYAFSQRRHQHAIAKTTPAVIVEMGFLTNPGDRGMLVGSPDIPAQGVAQGILRYLSERDPLDGAALIPPDFSSQKPASAEGVDVHAAPSESSLVLAHVDEDASFFPFQERDGWYEVLVRGESRVIGWVRKDLVQVDTSPFVFPPTTSGS